MTQQSSFMVAKVQDRKLDEVFRRLAVQWGGNDGSASVMGGVRVEPAFRTEMNEVWRKVLEADQYVIDHLSMKIGHLIVSFYRGGRQEPKSAYLDELLVQYSGSEPPTALQVVEIVQALQSALVEVPVGRFPGELTSEQQQMQAVHHEVMTRLESLAEDVIKNTAAHREKIEQSYLDRELAMKQAFESKRKSLEAEVAARQDVLRRKEEDLEDRRRKIDDRDNTHARREIRNGMLQEVKNRVERFGLSADTVRKRMNVRVGFLLSGLALASYLGHTIWELGGLRQDRSAMGADVFRAMHDPVEQYWLWIKLALTSIGLVFLLLYYVRWENAWAQRHADAEFQLQQFHLDVNRANWVIESCLEWKKETGNEPIPPELLDSMTRNLFVDRGVQQEHVLHPADELASAILGKASHVKLKTDGAEVDIDHPGKKLEAIRT